MCWPMRTFKSITSFLLLSRSCFSESSALGVSAAVPLVAASCCSSGFFSASVDCHLRGMFSDDDMGARIEEDGNDEN